MQLDYQGSGQTLAGMDRPVYDTNGILISGFEGAKMRAFETGATRSSAEGKADYEGFLNPLVLEAYGAYMLKHQVQADGQLRTSDNWQKGMTSVVYIKSLWRHFLDLWKLHRNYKVWDKDTGLPVTKQEACCALLFNTMGYLLNELQA